MIKLLKTKPYLLALFITVALAVWLASGQKTVEIKTTLPTTKPTTTETLISVQTREQQAEMLTREIVITGRSAPARTATLRAEIDASVVEIGAERGRRIKAGEMIVRLATDHRQARLNEAQALVKQREFEYQAQQNLLKKGYQAEVNLAETLALLESAKAQVEYARLELAHVVIRAPFDGTLVERMVEQGDYLSMGGIVAIVSEDNPLILSGEVTEVERFYVKIGMAATAKLVTGQTLAGRIRFVAVNADATTRTFPIEIAVPNPKGEIPAGVTTEIRIPVETISAHQISASLLTLSDNGILGIKAIGADQRVKFYPAQFARATTKGIWLSGLPERLHLITVGQGFVQAGQKVNPIQEDTIFKKE